MADPSRLLARATRAFVDHSTVDWPTLVGRAGGPHDRALLENLRALAGVRDARPNRDRLRAPAFAARLCARAVIAVAAVEIAAGLALLLTSYASGVPIARLPQLLLAVAFAVGAVPLALAGRHEPRSLFLLAAFASASCGFLRSALAALPSAWIAPFDPILRAFALDTLTPACLWLFALDFPKTGRVAALDRVARRIATAVWLASLAIFAINLLAVLPAIDAGPFASLLRDHPGRLFWQLYAIALVTSIAVIFVRSVRAPADERRKVARVASVLAAGTAPYLVASIVWAFRSSGSGLPASTLPVWLDRWIVVTLIAMPICATGAVIVDEPFSYRRLFAQRLPSLVTESALRAVRVALVAAGIVIVGIGRSAGEHESWSSSATVLLALVAAGLVITAHPGWLGAIERRVFRRAADRDAQLAGALDRIRIARGAREVLAVTARELQRALGVVRVRLLVEDDAGAYIDGGDTTPLAGRTALVALLRETETPPDLTDDGRLRMLLPADDRDWILAHEVELLAPLRRRDGSIGAVVAIGRKHGGFPFDRRDRWLISSLTAAAAACSDLDAHARDEGMRSSGAADFIAPDLAFQCVRCGLVSDLTPLACGCGGEATLASLPARLGDAFTVTRWLGSGGMGVVYLARDDRLGREVALKTLPELSADAVGRLQTEARAMAALNHEALATIYGLEIWRRTPVLVVEYLAGGTLAGRIARGPLSTHDTIELGIRLATALAYMHGVGALHRDLKPSNIGFTASGAAKLLDFGLTRSVLTNAGGDDEFLDAMPTSQRTIAGTPAYLPPEASAAPASTAFDLWALSATLLEALTGINPFARAQRGRAANRRSDAELTEFCARRIGTPPLRAFFLRALAADPDRRFQTSEDAIAALEDLRRE